MLGAWAVPAFCQNPPSQDNRPTPAFTVSVDFSKPWDSPNRTYTPLAGFQITPSLTKVSFRITFYSEGSEITMDPASTPVYYFYGATIPDQARPVLDLSDRLTLVPAETGWDEYEASYVITYEVHPEAPTITQNYPEVALHVEGNVPITPELQYHYDYVKSRMGTSGDFGVMLYQVKMTSLTATPAKINQSTASSTTLTITATYENSLEPTPVPTLTLSPNPTGVTASGVTMTSGGFRGGSSETIVDWTFDVSPSLPSTYEQLIQVTVAGGHAYNTPDRTAQSRSIQLPVDYVKPLLKYIQPLGSVNDETTRFTFELQYNEAMDTTALSNDISLTFTPENEVSNTVFVGSATINWKNDSTCRVTYTVYRDANNIIADIFHVSATGGFDFAGNPTETSSIISDVNVDQRIIGVRVEMHPYMIQRTTEFATLKFTFGQEMDTLTTPQFNFTGYTGTYPNWPDFGNGLVLMEQTNNGRWTPGSRTEWSIRYAISEDFSNSEPQIGGYYDHGIGVNVHDAQIWNPPSTLAPWQQDSVFGVDFNLPSCNVKYVKNNVADEFDKIILTPDDYKLTLRLTYDTVMNVNVDPKVEFVGLLNPDNLFTHISTTWVGGAGEEKICWIAYAITPQEISTSAFVRITEGQNAVGVLQGASSSADVVVIDMLPLEASYEILDQQNTAITTPITCDKEEVRFIVTFNQAMTPRRDSLLVFPSYKIPFLEQQSITWNRLNTVATVTYAVNGNYASNQSNIPVKVLPSTTNAFGRPYPNTTFANRFATVSNPPTIVSKDINGPLCHDESNGAFRFSLNSNATPFTFSVTKDSVELAAGDYTTSSSGTDAEISGLGAGEYAIKIIDTQRCFLKYDTVFVNPDSLIITASVAGHRERDTEGSIAVQAAGGTAPYYYVLEYKDENGAYFSFSSLSSHDTAATLNNLIENEYKLSTSDANGCIGNVISELLITDRRTPTLFTPEGGALPEIFMEGNHIEIYDRTGTLIHSGNNGWDGKYKGKPARPDVYFYIVTFKDQHKKKGTIQLYKKN
jgi:gliding motility-associated-like protein